jgi:hypothetical protein
MGWTKAQSDHLLKLFREGKAPYSPDQGSSISAAVIKDVWNSNPIFQLNYKLKNFYPLYQRKAAEFICEKSKSEARRRQSLEVKTCFSVAKFLVHPNSSSLLLVLLISFLVYRHYQYCIYCRKYHRRG